MRAAGVITDAAAGMLTMGTGPTVKGTAIIMMGTEIITMATADTKGIQVGIRAIIPVDIRVVDMAITGNQ
jgi:hypothetical protein